MTITATRNLLAAVDPLDPGHRLLDLRFNRVTVGAGGGVAVYSGNLATAVRLCAALVKAGVNDRKISAEELTEHCRKFWRSVEGEDEAPSSGKWIGVFKEGEPVLEVRSQRHLAELEKAVRGAELERDAMAAFAMEVAGDIGEDGVTARSQTCLTIEDGGRNLDCIMLSRAFEGEGRVIFSLQKTSGDGGLPRALELSADLIEAANLSARLKMRAEADASQTGVAEEAEIRRQIDQVRQRVIGMIRAGYASFKPEIPAFIKSA